MRVYPFALQARLDYLRTYFGQDLLRYTTLLMTFAEEEAMIHCLRFLIGRSRTRYDINRP